MATKLTNSERDVKRDNSFYRHPSGTSPSTTSTSYVDTGVETIYTAGDRDETVKVIISILFRVVTSGWIYVALEVDGVVQNGVFYNDYYNAWNRTSRTFMFDVNRNCSARLRLVMKVSSNTGTLNTSSTSWSPTFNFEAYPRQS